MERKRIVVAQSPLADALWPTAEECVRDALRDEIASGRAGVFPAKSVEGLVKDVALYGASVVVLARDLDFARIPYGIDDGPIGVNMVEVVIWAVRRIEHLLGRPPTAFYLPTEFKTPPVANKGGLGPVYFGSGPLPGTPRSMRPDLLEILQRM